MSLLSDVRKDREINNLPLIGKPRNMLIHYAIIIIEIPDFSLKIIIILPLLINNPANVDISNANKNYDLLDSKDTALLINTCSLYK